MNNSKRTAYSLLTRGSDLATAQSELPELWRGYHLTIPLTSASVDRVTIQPARAYPNRFEGENTLSLAWE